MTGKNAGESVLCGPTVDYGELRCVHELFEAQVERTPEAIAVEQVGCSLSYSALNAKANRLARHLQSLGAGRGTLVGVCLDRSIEAVVAVYAVLKAGAAYVPLDPAYPLERLAHMAESARLRVLITTGEARIPFPAGCDVAVVRLDTAAAVIDARCPDNLGTQATPDDLIYVIFTSGSTGQPKAAGVYHRGFANLIHWFVREFEISSADRVLLVSSLSFDLTQKNLYAPLVRGGELHLHPPGHYEVGRLARAIEEHGITLLNCTPSAFYPMIEPAEEERFRRVSTLRVVFLGGEPISVMRVRAWMENPNCRAEVANTYGPTECTDICGFYRLKRENLDRFPFVPLGYAVDNVQLAVVDEQSRLCGSGAVGELWVGGAGVGAGYINDRNLTAARFLPNLFPDIRSSKIYRTGDQVRLHSEGVLEFLGRLDYQVKIRGFRIELHEIEGQLNRHPGVRDSVVVVHRANEAAEPRLCCFFTARTAPAPDAATLRAFAASGLPDYMIPASVEVLECFPLSPNGKVDRKALEQLARERSAALEARGPTVTAAAQHGPTSNTLETGIRGIWQAVLGFVEVGMDQNFFDLGGSSIQLAQVHDRIQNLLRREVPLTDLFAHTTIRALAAHFSQFAAGDPTNASLQERARRQREAMMQRRLPQRS